MRQIIRHGQVITTELIDVKFPCKSGQFGRLTIAKSGLNGRYHWCVWEGMTPTSGFVDSFDAAVEAANDTMTICAGRKLRLDKARKDAEAVCAEYGNVTVK